jgi:hypothetical protein
MRLFMEEQERKEHPDHNQEEADADGKESSKPVSSQGKCMKKEEEQESSQHNYVHCGVCQQKFRHGSISKHHTSHRFCSVHNKYHNRRQLFQCTYFLQMLSKHFPPYTGASDY